MNIMRNNILIFVLTCFLCCKVIAQVPVEGSHYRPTGIAPKFFGPYAYPIPDLDEAKVSDKLTFQIAGDVNIGHIGGKGAEDYTYAPSFKLVLPLWTDRANLSCWGEFYEWWQDTEATRRARRYNEQSDLKSHGSGQIWIGLDILALRETTKRPSIVISANFLTAAGGNYALARHYDAPGYHFTGSIGKDIIFKNASALRFSGTIGFVCWQTDRGAQNDAFLVGAKASYNHRVFSLSAEYSYYFGWEKFGDAPQTFKTRLDFHIKRFSPFIYYVHGVEDYPFDQIRVGLKVSFDVLKYLKKDTNR